MGIYEQAMWSCLQRACFILVLRMSWQKAWLGQFSVIHLSRSFLFFSFLLFLFPPLPSSLFLFPYSKQIIMYAYEGFLEREGGDIREKGKNKKIPRTGLVLLLLLLPTFEKKFITLNLITKKALFVLYLYSERIFAFLKKKKKSFFFVNW